MMLSFLSHLRSLSTCSVSFISVRSFSNFPEHVYRHRVRWLVFYWLLFDPDSICTFFFCLLFLPFDYLSWMVRLPFCLEEKALFYWLPVFTFLLSSFKCLPSFHISFIVLHYLLIKDFFSLILLLFFLFFSSSFKRYISPSSYKSSQLLSPFFLSMFILFNFVIIFIFFFLFHFIFSSLIIVFVLFTSFIVVQSFFLLFFSFSSLFFFVSIPLSSPSLKNPFACPLCPFLFSFFVVILFLSLFFFISSFIFYHVAFFFHNSFTLF